MASTSRDTSSPFAPNSQSTVKRKSKKYTATAPSMSAGKNEGADLNWDYKPAPGDILLESNEPAGEYDWNEMQKNDHLELWLIRIPDSLKPKYLDNVKIDFPETSKSAVVGTIPGKHATFDIWNIGANDHEFVGGEEIKSVSCLLPKSSEHGTLYQAPKPINRHFVVSAQTVKPKAGLSGDQTSANIDFKRPPRYSHPVALLTHRFLPYGAAKALNGVVPEPVNKDEDVTPDQSQVTLPNTSVAVQKRAKKRKGEVKIDGTPASKKAKKTRSS